MPPSTPRIIYLANRPIGIACLEILLKAHIEPVALVVPAEPYAEGTATMKALVPHIPTIEGKEAFLRSTDLLKEREPAYLLSVHFPHMIPPDILAIPTMGALNLHPAYLPFNRGWHTPSWAILDGTPYGATLHWVDSGVDTGPVALQQKIEVFPHDSAHTLYQRALGAEIALFREAIPYFKNGTLPRIPQSGEGTVHRKKDLEEVRKIDPTALSSEELFRRLRALTTNKLEEAAYMEEGGARFRLRLEIVPEQSSPLPPYPLPLS